MLNYNVVSKMIAFKAAEVYANVEGGMFGILPKLWH